MPRYIALSVESHTTGCGHDVQRKQNLVEQTIMLQNVTRHIRCGSGTRSRTARSPASSPRFAHLRQPRHAVGDGIADREQDRVDTRATTRLCASRTAHRDRRDEQPEIIQRQRRERCPDRRDAFRYVEHRRVGRLRDRVCDRPIFSTKRMARGRTAPSRHRRDRANPAGRAEDCGARSLLQHHAVVWRDHATRAGSGIGVHVDPCRVGHRRAHDPRRCELTCRS